jgi:hypothetical protein
MSSATMSDLICAMRIPLERWRRGESNEPRGDVKRYVQRPENGKRGGSC